MMRWKGGFGGEVANREFVSDLLVSLRSRPRDDSLRENSASRVGSDGMCSQGGFNYCLDSKIVPVEGLEILLKGQWQWRFVRFRRLRIGDSPQMHDYRQLLYDFGLFASALLLQCTTIDPVASALQATRKERSPAYLKLN